ncbi:MAG: metal ABC transporter solute-binding protein, Zn/Mn family [Spirochaeta sp.]
MKNTHRSAIIGLTAVVLLGYAIGPVFARGAAEAQENTVVAEHSILGDMVARIAGDTISLSVLVGPGQDPHAYEPAPADSIQLRNAVLVFENGLELTGWFDGLYIRSGSTARRVAVAEGLHGLPASDEHDDEHDEDEHHEDEHDEDEHDHGEYDPHVWQSVHYAIEMVEIIRDTLAEEFPQHADTYRENAAAYIEELESLDGYIREQVQRIPPHNRLLVTSHGAYDYFAEEYGFDVVGTALGSITTEVQDPSAGQIAVLVDTIRRLEIPAVFAEAIVNRSVVDTIANEAEVRVLYPLYSDSLGDTDSGAVTYLEMMRHNIDLIVDGLAN